MLATPFFLRLGRLRLIKKGTTEPDRYSFHDAMDARPLRPQELRAHPTGLGGKPVARTRAQTRGIRWTELEAPLSISLLTTLTRSTALTQAVGFVSWRCLYQRRIAWETSASSVGAPPEPCAGV